MQAVPEHDQHWRSEGTEHSMLILAYPPVQQMHRGLMHIKKSLALCQNRVLMPILS